MDFKCSACPIVGKSKTSRMPNGWRRHPKTDGPICKVCWKRMYMPRTVTLAIAGPVDGAEWPDLRTALSDAWTEVTKLKNWAIKQLLMNDVTPTAGDKKLEPMNPVYLFGLFAQYANRRAWDGMASSASAVLQNVQALYKARRYEAVFQNNRSIDSYTWPQPFPITNQTYSIERNEHGVITVSVALGGRRWTLRIRNDRSISTRYRGFLNAIFGGEAVLGEGNIYARKVGPNDDRNGIWIRNPAGGENRMYRVLLAIAGWFPRGQFVQGEGELHVHPGTDSFIYVEQEDRDTWVINGDANRRRLFAYKKFMRRIAQDTKQERRVPKRRRRELLDAGESRAITEQNRAKSFREETTTQLAELAKRRKVAKVVVHAAKSEDFTFFPSFAAYEWLERLKTKLEERGIEYVNVAEKQSGA